MVLLGVELLFTTSIDSRLWESLRSEVQDVRTPGMEQNPYNSPDDPNMYNLVDPDHVSQGKSIIFHNDLPQGVILSHWM